MENTSVTAAGRREKHGEGKGLHLSETAAVIFCYFLPMLLVAALVVTGVWGNGQRKLAEAYRTTNEGIYRHAYNELTDSVYNMNIALSKLLVSEAPSTLAHTLEDIRRESGAITALMGRIPQSHTDSVELNRFLVRIGDYAHSLSTSVLGGRPISDGDRAQLLALYNASERVYLELSDRLNGGNIPLEALDGTKFFATLYSGDEHEESDGSEAQATGVETGNGEAAGNAASDTPQKGEQPTDATEAGEETGGKTEGKYPPIVYDGPFSESYEKREPKSSGLERIDEARAKELAKWYLGDGADEIEVTGVTEGRLACYELNAKTGDGAEAELAITVNGGLLRYMRIPSSFEKEGVPDGAELEELEKAGIKWLAEHGFVRMEPTYAQFYGGSVLISYAPTVSASFTFAPNGSAVEVGDGDGGEQGAGNASEAYGGEHEVMLCADLIRLRLERDGGRVIGADTENYLFNSSVRSFSSRILSAEDAAGNLSPFLEVKSKRLALIPLPDMSERLCYEFTGSFNGSEFIVYLDAVNGDEVQIFRLITDESGSAAL